MALGTSALACPQLLNDDFFLVRARDAGTAAMDCSPFELCGNACVDLQSDPLHCGECSAAVEPGEICSMGAGVPAATGCGTRTLCKGGCVSTDTHPFFCGSCDTRCKPGARCAMGRCECAPPTAKDCGDACRECCNDSDCPMDKVCSAGICELQCRAPLSACGDRCVDRATDPKNCGECRNDCGPGRDCVGGACR